MSSPPPSSGSPRLALALVCAGLLIVPLVAWLLLPPLTPAPQARPAQPVASVESAPSTLATRATAAPRAAPRDELARARELTGTVEDPEGRGVDGATVTCEANGELTATTDRAGRFTLGAEAEGCEAVARHSAFLESEPAPLTAGGDNVLRLQKGGGLRGVVVDTRNNPVTKYTLTIERFSTRQRPRDRQPDVTQAVDDPSGAFAREGLAPGRYVLTAQADGHPPARSDAVVIEVGATTDGVRIVLPESATLTGRVTDATSHEPIAGVRVSVDGTWFEGRTRPTATTDATGAYTLTDLPVGRVAVNASHEGYRPRVVPGLMTESGGTLEQDMELSHSDAGRGIESSGIGLVLGVNMKGVVVILVLPYGPAARAGLAAGDQVLAIDGTSTEDVPLSEVILRTMCPTGSQLTLRVARGDEPPREVALSCEAMAL